MVFNTPKQNLKLDRVYKIGPTCRTVSAGRTCPLGGFAPLWQAEISPRPFLHDVEGRAQALCAGSGSHCPCPYHALLQNPPTTQT